MNLPRPFLAKSRWDPAPVVNQWYIRQLRRILCRISELSSTVTFRFQQKKKRSRDFHDTIGSFWKTGFMIFATASAVVNNTPLICQIDVLVRQSEMGCLPPLNTVLPNLIIVPRQKALTPPSSQILAMACMVVVTFAACDLVLIVSNG